jgi:two-component system KDP operon response regulator KdpE
MRSPHYSSPVPRVLIVDDDPSVRKFLRLTLQAENFNVLEAGTAEQALMLMHAAVPDLMILDLTLPDFDGQQVIQDVRLTSSLPILVLSARTEEREKIAALENGADDYMSKPFEMQELISHVRLALRQRDEQRAHIHDENVVTGELNIRLDAREVMRGQQIVQLSDEEYALLRMLAVHGGRVLTSTKIERALWGQEGSTAQHQNLQHRITTLRRKLEAEPSFPRYIVTEPAVGYRLEILPPAGSVQIVA